MVIKREVAYGIVQGLSDFWKCEELQDFTVTLATTKFGCHRFLLAACSGFFRGLFRSGMKETELKCVTIEEISSETFELILETLYTGDGVLTNDNVINIWKAAHQLQIPFLIKECEEFALATLYLDNYIVRSFFESHKGIDIIWPFIMKNANAFFQTTKFLEMQVPDVLRLIQSQDLETTSEDDVVLALLKWMEFRPRQQDETSEDSDKECMCQSSGEKRIKTDYTSFKALEAQNPYKNKTKDLYDDERVEQLPDLLSNTRTCLLSPTCLKMLISHPLVNKTKLATDIIIDAFYLTSCKYESTMAIVHVGLSTEQWLQLPDLFSKSRVNFVAIDKSLYALGETIATVQITTDFSESTSHSTKQIFELTNGAWSDVNVSFKVPPESSVVVADAFIYILSSTSRQVWQMDPTAKTSIRKTNLPYTSSICHLTNCDQFILVFYIMAGEKDKAAVSCFDTSQNTWKRLDDLNSPAIGMISFKESDSTYLLLTNGNLFLIEILSNDVEFKYLAKLWNCDWTLHGAVIFRDELYIYGVKSEALKQDSQKQTSLDFIVNKIVYMESEDTVLSTFIPLTLNRQCIV
ncbi:kelch-like protein 40 [Biomphalaria pfeifferi]|uniref:Kelch-like protein 40 n=1 Tax=Biomphalaria pfeifferi TaxID=112525 RepID=A0AAD8B6N7_BIOPF|nr:kelch-like protein 40 [Biomphalaria pfeifferi]